MYSFPELFGGGQAVDRVRQQVIPNTPIQLNVIGESRATSKHGRLTDTFPPPLTPHLQRKNSLRKTGSSVSLRSKRKTTLVETS